MNKTHLRIRHSLSQLGLSMVELMVAITIGSILSAGVVQIFISNKRAYQVSDSLGELQENGRSALTRMNHSIMMADHWGSMTTADVATEFDNNAAAIIAGITAKGGCGGAWALQTSTNGGNTTVNSIQGYEGAGDISTIEAAEATLPVGCITDYVAGSDIIVVRYADSSQLIPNSSVQNAANPNYAQTVFIRGGITSNAKVLTPLTTVALGGGIPNPATPNPDGVYNYPLAIELYYLKTCSETDVNGCTNTKPSLARLRLSSETATPPQVVEEIVAENIEQMQFLYGVDIDNDGFLDQYNSAFDINEFQNDPIDWNRVISVHVSFIARSDTKEPDYKDANSYQLTDLKYTPADNEYRRKRYDQVIQIRNRTRS
ncbi:MAG: PilW family protein [Thiohalomonadales bacterium]